MIRQVFQLKNDDIYNRCKTCGDVFEQYYIATRDRFTEFKTCPSCRSKKARDSKEGKQEDPSLVESVSTDQEGTEKAFIEYTPHDGQMAVHKSRAKHKLIAAGSRWGKDRCSIMEFIQKFAHMLSEDRGSDMVPRVHGWLIAPTFTMARQMWREFRTYFPKQWVVNVWETDRMIQTINDGIIEVRSADDPDSLVGVGLDIIVVTEAARIKQFDISWSNLEMRLMSPGRGIDGKGGHSLVNSTPRGKNMFYDMYLWGQREHPNYDKDWHSWKFASYENPYLTLKDKEVLDRIKKRFPDRIYRQEILAEFLAEGNSVFPYAKDLATYEGPTDPDPNRSYVIGYDPARSVDYSGVYIRDDLGNGVYIAQWTGKAWTSQMNEIEHLSRKYNNALVVVDKTGLGDTIPEALDQRGVYVEPVHFNSQIKENLVNNLAMLMEQKSIRFVENEAFIAEIGDYEYQTTSTGNVKYGASSSSKHDDLVTAAMLSYKDYNSQETEFEYMGFLGGIEKKKKTG